MEREQSPTPSHSDENQLIESVEDQNHTDNFEVDDTAQPVSPIVQNPSLEESLDLYLHNLAQFYLKLESEL